MFKIRDYQDKIAQKAIKILKECGFVYLYITKVE